MINLIPTVALEGLLGLSIIGIISGLFFTSLPIIKHYNKTMLVTCISIAIGLSAALGSQHTHDRYAFKLAEYRLKVLESEKLAEAANAQIEYVFVDRIQPIKEIQVVVQEKLRDIAVTVDQKCQITAEVVDILNTAAQGPKK